jgi:hypothetical protein
VRQDAVLAKIQAGVDEYWAAVREREGSG